MRWRSRTPRVNSIEGPRWTSLIGVMSPRERDEALRSVARKVSCGCSAHVDPEGDCLCDCPLHMHAGDTSDDGWGAR